MSHYDDPPRVVVAHCLMCDFNITVCLLDGTAMIGNERILTAGTYMLVEHVVVGSSPALLPIHAGDSSMVEHVVSTCDLYAQSHTRLSLKQCHLRYVKCTEDACRGLKHILVFEDVLTGPVRVEQEYYCG